MTQGRFLSTRPFLLRGPGGQKFYVHSNLIAQHSRVFDRDVNGGMREMDDRQIEILDVEGDIDDGTVMRFIEFAYTGDYTTPPPTKRQKTCTDHNSTGLVIHNPSDQPEQISPRVDGKVETVAVEEGRADRAGQNVVAAPESQFGHVDGGRQVPWVIQPKYKYSSMWVEDEPPAKVQNAKRLEKHISVADTKQHMWQAFISKANLLSKAAWEPRKAEGLPDDYSLDLLCHAQLYVFSSRYECHGLAELALQKLRLTLSRFDPSEGLAAAIDLIRYTYDHTQDYDQGSDKLRVLVIEYTVCHLEKFCQDESFRTELRQEGDFAVDLLTQAMQRLDG